MSASKGELGSDLAKLDATTDADIARQIAEDPDSAPELTDEELEQAEIYEGDRFIRRVGRPKGSGVKESVTLRLDRECSTITSGRPGRAANPHQQHAARGDSDASSTQAKGGWSLELKRQEH